MTELLKLVKQKKLWLYLCYWQNSAGKWYYHIQISSPSHDIDVNSTRLDVAVRMAVKKIKRGL